MGEKKVSKLKKCNEAHTYSALNIANYVIEYLDSKSIHITNLHLQKMLYYIQGFNFQLFGQPLFNEDIEAWKYGPVVPEVYYYYKRFVSQPIFPIYEENNMEICEEVANNIKQISDAIYLIDPWDLVEKTHSEYPWRKNYEPFTNNVIPKDDIKKQFCEKDN